MICKKCGYYCLGFERIFHSCNLRRQLIEEIEVSLGKDAIHAKEGEKK